MMYYMVRIGNLFWIDVGLGIVHSGVVVDGIPLKSNLRIGREYSYGEGGGIISTKPKNITGVKYRETFLIGTTYLTPEEIKDVIKGMEKKFTGDDYHLLSK